MVACAQTPKNYHHNYYSRREKKTLHRWPMHLVYKAFPATNKLETKVQMIQMLDSIRFKIENREENKSSLVACVTEHIGSNSARDHASSEQRCLLNHSDTLLGRVSSGRQPWQTLGHLPWARHTAAGHCVANPQTCLDYNTRPLPT